MATATLNPVIILISGRIGNFVFYRRKYTQCIRTYVVPNNPDTASQRKVRRSFADAVKSWQSLTVEERYKYSRKARGARMSGYNLYISEYIKNKMSAESKQNVLVSLGNSVNPCALQRRIHSVSASIINSFSIVEASGEYCHSSGST